MWRRGVPATGGARNGQTDDDVFSLSQGSAVLAPRQWQLASELGIVEGPAPAENFRILGMTLRLPLLAVSWPYRILPEMVSRD